ncbi:endonuclease [Thermosipho ferrireducens]|uniref:Endonuclease n=1 Tax=Thermosipho ferrireducens TaxID=2571116 RepID=A0ABX7SAD8_9BACT|nr:endonuclease [Thermosipho ferrireducens]QTA38386.1 endonuclease [Thermosipho ferrireducens]
MEGLENLYYILKDIYGELGKWWPGSSEEIFVTAILTQNTNWKNVEKALENIYQMITADGSLLKKLNSLNEEKIAELIKPAGFYNLKAMRLKNLLSYLSRYDFNIEILKKKRNVYVIREELLNINGIGKETADSIILYALEKPIFVIDSYTRRLVNRMYDKNYKKYDELQNMFLSKYPADVKLYQELHGLIVEHSKKFCRKNPRCKECPVKDCYFRVRCIGGQENGRKVDK